MSGDIPTFNSGADGEQDPQVFTLIDGDGNPVNFGTSGPNPADIRKTAGDVRNWYNSGKDGPKAADGICIIGADGLPVDFSNMGGGGGGDVDLSDYATKVELNDAVDAIDQRIDVVDQRIDGVDQAIADLDQRIDDLPSGGGGDGKAVFFLGNPSIPLPGLNRIDFYPVRLVDGISQPSGDFFRVRIRDAGLYKITFDFVDDPANPLPGQEVTLAGFNGPASSLEMAKFQLNGKRNVSIFLSDQNVELEFRAEAGSITGFYSNAVAALNTATIEIEKISDTLG